MTETTNYHLPQWAENDPVRREDFNGAMASIDAGMYAAEKVTAVAYTPDNKPYVIGSYAGNHGTKTVTLGFRPSILIISGDPGSTSLTGHYQQLGYYLGVVSGALTYDTVTLTDTGFTVVRSSSSYPQLNEGSQKYIYIAFR